MNTVLILSNLLWSPNDEQMSKLRKHGEVSLINFKGQLDDIAELKTPDEKILGMDPDVVEWDLDLDVLLKNSKNLKAIFPQSTSFDWVHPAELRKNNIDSSNAPYWSTDSVAEYIIALTLEGARAVPLHIKNDWKIDWNVKPFQLKGKKFGIIGLGRIGQRVAELATGMGMEVIFWNRSKKDTKFTQVDEIEEVFKRADVLTVTLVENDETRALLKKEYLDLMKKTALVVGINRVLDLLDEEYIFEKVAKGELHGYAFESDSYKPLETYQGNVWAMPPIGWFTLESNQNLVNVWVNNMVSYLEGDWKNRVN